MLMCPHDSGLLEWVNNTLFDTNCQCSWTEITYLEHSSPLTSLTSQQLKIEKALFRAVSSFRSCTFLWVLQMFPSFLFLFPLSSLSFMPWLSFPLFFSLFSFRLVLFLTGFQSMGDDSCEIWVGLVLYSFSLQSMSLPESWQDERAIFFLFVCSSAHHFLALSTLSTFPASFSSSIIVLWIFILPPPYPSFSFFPLS